MSEKSSYAQILRSSSIMGGAAGITMLLGMVRTKVAAVLIGTVGVGLLASFTAIQSLLGTLAGLGIQTSAVRKVAAAVSSNDQQAISRAVLTLNRICWLTGLLGMVAMILLSPLLSQLTFGHRDYSLDIAALGIVVLFANISSGKMALIQGMRRIGDLARVNVISAALATVTAIGMYGLLGLRGIVPSLIAIAGIQLTLSWHFARRVAFPPVSLSWRQTFNETADMIKLGLVLMWSGLLMSAVTYASITLIAQQHGVEAVGYYSAAFALSGLFASFVLNAMGADYYPRLTGVAHNNSALNNLVNEQTEIGLLLAVPGLLTTLALAPWIIEIFYTKEFLPAVELLQWFVLGCLGRVISWPLGFVMLALGNGRWFFLTETSFNVLHVSLIAVGLFFLGIKGVAIAFFIMYIGYSLAVYAVAHHLTGFKWTRQTIKIGKFALLVVAATFFAITLLPPWPATLLGITISLAMSIYSLRSLVRRLGNDHRLTRTACTIPGIRSVCGLNEDKS